MLLTVNHAAFSYDSLHMILKNITFQLDKKASSAYWARMESVKVHF